MARALIAGFLVLHGWVHVAVYAMPKQSADKAPFDPTHSWVLSAAHVAQQPARAMSLALAFSTAAAYVVAGIVALFGTALWAPVAIAAAGIGLMLKVTYFSRWLLLGVALDVGVIYAAAAQWPGSLF